MHQGRRIKIPSVEESSHNWVKFAKMQDLNPPLAGRPTKVLKRLIDLGFQKNWWNEKIFEDLIIFGWDREYLKNDAPILTLPFKYFIKDMDWSKKKRLQEVDKNGRELHK
jgi:hypothetical protein